MKALRSILRWRDVSVEEQECLGKACGPHERVEVETPVGVL